MKKKHPYATCPECERPLKVNRGTVDTFPDHARPLDPEGLGSELEPCYASGWLVEDEDRLAGRWPR